MKHVKYIYRSCTVISIDVADFSCMHTVCSHIICIHVLYVAGDGQDVHTGDGLPDSPLL